MFSPLGLFHSLPCPNKSQCRRKNCLFSHKSGVVENPVSIPYDTPQPVASSSALASRSSVPAKRPAASSPTHALSSANAASSLHPQRKLQKVGTTQKPLALPTASRTPTGVPVLRVNAAQSKIPVATRQTMLKSLYDHFVVLYDAVLPQEPSLASEHALRQEEEIYNRASKSTYRNAVITSIASIKSRPPPTNISHPSIGTTNDIAARTAEAHALTSLNLTSAHLMPLILSRDQLQKWGFLAEIPEPWGPGGQSPSAEGSRVKCERCAVAYVVQPLAEGKASADECTYHWGKAVTRNINGERMRMYTCCHRPTTEGGGCTQGPHVFYESDLASLHARHPFSSLKPSSFEGKKKERDVVALDCEMIYTTGGFRVARVSIVDARGQEIFDELVKMDDGVEVVDFNTRFSGITATQYAAKARRSLREIRCSLDEFLSQDTILLGHGLENDLRTLRIMHHRCVDTAILFEHPRGFPFRKALRDLTKEHLGRTIQTGGGTAGHSSIEDSIATLDLVKWFVYNKVRQPPLSAATPATGTSSSRSITMAVGSFRPALDNVRAPPAKEAFRI
ncbi:hypothetical protein HETIRDRAFT_472359 [Heterobasidion irregulare TC 32-1]|uniref:Exonuclease domain-containing protein n=1 Tax=Heterobasidion irregulare (strain TC 32-1) TaxID=747525 RepID=W4KFZ8_HETIT|nr:uncharacterized protein HETIRDRAFT_472359 [Heterobasidion irregulare TC 32-1]ETW83986.1 hypothetical protein HETIRDRAFT_472359 [Heterobasidion irregulare TC 32-1]